MLYEVITHVASRLIDQANLLPIKIGEKRLHGGAGAAPLADQLMECAFALQAGYVEYHQPAQGQLIDDAGSGHHGHAKARSHGRITSYNVCYTKLLRNSSELRWASVYPVEFLPYLYGEKICLVN